MFGAISPLCARWREQCGRWDLLDVVRMTYALLTGRHPVAKKEDGSPSFKLEHLSKANGLVHGLRTMR